MPIPDSRPSVFWSSSINAKNLSARLFFDDQAFCTQIANLLSSQAGRAIKDIGDLDISDTL